MSFYTNTFEQIEFKSDNKIFQLSSYFFKPGQLCSGKQVFFFPSESYSDLQVTSKINPTFTKQWQVAILRIFTLLPTLLGTTLTTIACYTDENLVV